MCKTALERFCVEYWPCEYRDKKDRHCLNTSTTHQKGHQDKNGVITSGKYMSTFTAKDFWDRWVKILKKLLSDHVAKFEELKQREQHLDLSRPRTGTEAGVMFTLHASITKSFYSDTGRAEHYYNNATCLSCLMVVPQHALGCGHVLCATCIRDYALDRSESLIVLEQCPLHVAQRIDWPVHLKPDFAGVRVLCLDGFVPFISIP